MCCCSINTLPASCLSPSFLITSIIRVAAPTSCLLYTSVIGGNFVEDDDVKLGGNIGDALAASSLVTKRVCYELNGDCLLYTSRCV